MIWALFAFLALIYSVLIYNRLIFSRNIAGTAWASIDINIKLRNDLIPLIVSIVKQYSSYEKNTFKELAELRASLESSDSIKKKALINQKITESMNNFFMVAENYPKLMANKSFLRLQNELSTLESNIAFKRQFYNDAVFKYNNFLMSFPSSIVAKIFGFKVKESFSNDSKYLGVKL
ncbi:MAG: LemA family protein [Candidatus Nanoarchaeia archaeon]|jgi:LemA protein